MQPKIAPSRQRWVSLCAFSVVAAATALVVADSDSRPVTSCCQPGDRLAIAGLVITMRQHCPAGSIVHTFAAATALGGLAWNVDAAGTLVASRDSVRISVFDWHSR